jgi:hypothetical protein
MVKCSGYILGEFGHLLHDVAPLAVFRLLHPHFLTSASTTQCLLLSSYAKMLAHAPKEDSLHAQVQKVSARNQNQMKSSPRKRIFSPEGGERISTALDYDPTRTVYGDDDDAAVQQAAQNPKVDAEHADFSRCSHV